MSLRTLIMATLVSCCAATSQGAFSYTGTTVTENFNSIAATTLSATNGTRTPIAGTGFDATRISGTGTTNLTLTPGTGSANAGGLYNYGTSNTATDRALGLLASGSFVGAFGVVITNNSGAALTSITLRFNTEVYRNSSTVVDRLAFAYGLSGGSGSTAITAANYLTSTALTTVSSLDLVGNAPIGGTTGAIASPPTQTLVTGTITLSVANGQSIFLRWTDSDSASADAGIAIDDFSFSATPAVSVPEPASVILLGLGLVGSVAVGRKRLAR